MAVFGIEIENNGTIASYMEQIDEKLNQKSKTPFYRGNVIPFAENKYIIYIKTLYPPYFIFGLVVWVMGWIFTGRFLLAWFLPGLIILFPLIFWHWGLFYLLLRIGARKSGYKQKMKLL